MEGLFRLFKVTVHDHLSCDRSATCQEVAGFGLPRPTLFPPVCCSCVHVLLRVSALILRPPSTHHHNPHTRPPPCTALAPPTPCLARLAAHVHDGAWPLAASPSIHSRDKLARPSAVSAPIKSPDYLYIVSCYCPRPSACPRSKRISFLSSPATALCP